MKDLRLTACPWPEQRQETVVRDLKRERLATVRPLRCLVALPREMEGSRRSLRVALRLALPRRSKDLRNQWIASPREKEEHTVCPHTLVTWAAEFKFKTDRLLLQRTLYYTALQKFGR